MAYRSHLGDCHSVITWKRAFCCWRYDFHLPFWATSLQIENILEKFLKILPVPYHDYMKKNFQWRQGRCPLSYWVAPCIRESELSHLHDTSNSAHSRMGCLHRKRKSPPLEEEKKADARKRASGSRCSFYYELANWVILETKDGADSPITAEDVLSVWSRPIG